jgi:hypothetical protein
MILIDPSSLKGARAYFTSFDRHIVKKSADEMILRKNIERDLKILFLIKGTVVSAASNLTSTTFAYEFLKENPILLQENLLIPALRKDKTSPLYYLERVKNVSKEKFLEMRHFYEEYYTHAVSWELQDNSDWFRIQFLEGLSNKDSVLRMNLEGLSHQQLETTLLRISSVEVLDKSLIEEIAEGLPVHEGNIIRHFRDLLYQISGARVVNCESVLPQENYIDYSISDIKNRETILSDTQIFWKIFLELFFETINKPKLPIEVLDLLSFEDLNQIRKPLLETDFMEEYEQVVQRAVQKNSDINSSEFLLSLEELLSIRERLITSYRQIFENELGTVLQRKGVSKSDLIKTNFNVALQYNPMDSSLSLEGAICGLMNSPTDFTTPSLVRQYDRQLRVKVEGTEDFLRTGSFQYEARFVDMIKLLFDRINSRTFS